MYRVELKERQRQLATWAEIQFLMYRVELKVLIFSVMGQVLQSKFLMYRVELKDIIGGGNSLIAFPFLMYRVELKVQL